MTHQTLISPEDLAACLDDPRCVVFDCRHQLMDPDYGARVYAVGHIPGARHADMDRDLSAPGTPGAGRHPLPDLERFGRWLGEQGVGDDSQVVAYDDSGGAMAARLWWMLRYLRHPAVCVLDGGFPRWSREGRPVTGALPVVRSARFTPNPDAGALVSLADVERQHREPGALLVDARGAERFEGKTEPIDPVAGHIPGARNRPYGGNLTDAGDFREPDALRDQFTALFGGVPPEQTVHYCGSGVSACHNLLAMAHAGLPIGRLYVGSWSQWCADPARPVETGRRKAKKAASKADDPE